MNEQLETFIYETQINQWMDFLERITNSIMNNVDENDSRQKYYLSSLWDSINRFVKLKTVREHKGKYWIWRTIMKHNKEAYEEFNESYIDIVGYYLDEWYEISGHPNITIEFIRNNPKYPWDLFGMTKNPNVDLEMVKNDPNYFPKKSHSLWFYLSHNPNVSCEFVKNNPDLGWDWDTLTRNIPCDDIMSNLDYPWVWNAIPYNKTFTYEYALKLKDTIDIVRIRWNELVLTHPNVKMDVLEPLINSSRNLNCIIRNPNFTFDYVKNSCRLNWNMEYISSIMDIPFDYIRTHRCYKYNWDHIAKTKPWKEIKFILDSKLSLYSSIKNELNKCWKNITINPSVYLEDIQNNPQYPWVMEEVFYNPNITWDYIKSCKGITITRLGCNPFTHQLRMIRNECILKWYAARRIRKWWLFKIYLNPLHHVGKKRLMRSYQEMMEDND